MMPDLLIRNVSIEAIEAIDAAAAAVGQSRQEFLRILVESFNERPVVRAIYTLRARTSDGALNVYIRRTQEGLKGHSAQNCTREQLNAYKLATSLVERNGPGDRERAISLLSTHFDEVFESA